MMLSPWRPSIPSWTPTTEARRAETRIVLAAMARIPPPKVTSAIRRQSSRR